MSTKPTGSPPILVTRRQAAELLGGSINFYKTSVQPELRVVKRGRRFVRIPVAELERWARQNSAMQ
jgi:hypothetical protein